MKDIVNPNVRDALERLERAIGRLDAAAKVRGKSEDLAGLKESFDRLAREHATLKDTAGRVATRLDAVIGRVRAGLDE